MPKNETDLPSTLERSDEHAQRTWQKTQDSRLTSRTWPDASMSKVGRR
jgi:hypothetical protein